MWQVVEGLGWDQLGLGCPPILPRQKLNAEVALQPKETPQVNQTQVRDHLALTPALWIMSIKYILLSV